jgi:Ca2+-binding RTX toxin-like protein
VGGGGNDTLNGGLGNDFLSGGTPVFDGPSLGIDTADYSDRTEPIFLSGGVTIGSETDSLGNIERFISGSGEDTLNILSAITYVDGGGGDDTINYEVFRGAPNPTAHGGDGNDTIVMEASDQTAHYFGDAGDDTFKVNNDSTAHDFNGGDGIDTVDYSGYSGGSLPVMVSFDNVTNDGAPAELQNPNHARSPDNVHSDIEKIIGTDGNDTLIGSNNDETLIGGAGSDSIDGGEGDDLIEGNGVSANQHGHFDTLVGGAGQDTIVTSNSRDSIVSDMNDVLVNAIPTISGTAGDDVIQIELHDPSTVDATVNGVTSQFQVQFLSGFEIDAGAGNDSISIDPAVSLPTGNTINGGDGNDTIVVGASNDSVSGGAGDDSLSGSGQGSLIGGDGNDTLVSNNGNYAFNAGAGNNVLIQNTADGSTTSLINHTLRINGTSGDDQIGVRKNHSNSLGVIINGAALTYPLSDITLIQIEGGSGNDRITLDSNVLISSKIYGGDGDDIITGGSGNDRILGGAGNDWIEGAAGNDIIYGEAGNDRLFGGDGRDYIVGGTGMNLIRGEGGVDRILADTVLDDLRGNKGDSIVNDA